MSRIVVALFAFAVILCAWIIYDPISRISAERDVADDSSFSTDAPVTLADLEEEVSLEVSVDRLGQPVEVTRSLPAEEPARPVLREITRFIQEPVIRVDDQTLAQTTAGVLAGLGLDLPSPAETAVDDPMATMTLGVLDDIRSVAVALPAAEPTALQTLVIRALQEGQTDLAIDAAVNAAALSGEVAVPDVMVTSDGRVDTSVLLSSIISEARVAAGEARALLDPTQGVGGEGVEVRVVQTADETRQFRFYTVNEGDSLGAIAIKFYGDAIYYSVIFDANRTILSSPDRIKTGQRLVIPDAV